MSPNYCEERCRKRHAGLTTAMEWSRGNRYPPILLRGMGANRPSGLLYQYAIASYRRFQDDPLGAVGVRCGKEIGAQFIQILESLK